MVYNDKYGVSYSEDRKILEKCPRDYEGEYIIPEGVIRIRENAFYRCSRLTSIIIPDSVTNIGYYAFKDCHSLSSINIPDSVTSIGWGVFDECTSLTTVNIPNSITCIRFDAFNGCSSLTSITIPNSIKSIEDRAFYGCNSLTSITIPNSVKKIGSFAFGGCGKLSSISVESGNTIYDSRNHCNAIIETATNTMICGCKNTIIPDSVTCIGNYAFWDCSALTVIEIPHSVTHIGESAFAGCCNLTCIKIPYSITYIRVGAFGGCGKLSSISVESGNTIYDSRNHCNAIIETATNTLIRGCKNTIIPDSVTCIRDFSNCHSLSSINIPDSVTSIEKYAFYGCIDLTSITLPDSVKSIEQFVFSRCDNLKEICIPKGQKARFLQMGLKRYEDIVVERDNEELTILLNLAKAYESGIGVSQNIAQSVLFYTQAAAKGCAEAAYRLAEWYQNGEVLPLDLNKALDLYKQAAKSGYKDAEEKAQKIQQKIEAEEKKQADYLAERQIAQAKPYYLFFDTETAGLPPKGKYNVPVTNPDFWPRLVQLAWILTDKEGRVLNRKSKIIYPNGFSIPASATAVHHITTEHAMQVGEPLRDVLGEFMRDLSQAEKIVCHNVEFDQHIVGAELYSMDMDYKALMNRPSICTKFVSTNFCALPNTNGHSGYKWPSLPELYQILFGRDFENAHDALADITATKDCFFELKRRGIIRE